MSKLKVVLLGIFLLFLLVHIGITLFAIGTSGVYVLGMNPSIIAIAVGIFTFLVTLSIVINGFRLLRGEATEDDVQVELF